MCLKGHENEISAWQQPRVVPEVANLPGLVPTLSPPGLPLGIYTSQWKKAVPKTARLGGCNALREDKCAAGYAPSEMDYDFQGIFSTGTEVW